MDRQDAHLVTRIAKTERDLRAAERLRYTVFVEELGGDGPLVDHDNRYERDRFDPHFEHIVLVDTRRDDQSLDHVVGVYRVLTNEGATAAGQFYSEDEYDLDALKNSGRRLLELGRSCLHPDYRGGTAMYQLWTALSDYVRGNDIDILFGVASFHGTDIEAIAPSLSLLHHNHLAPVDVRVRAKPDVFQTMDLMPADAIDRKSAMRGVPSLIKAYLRLGGVVGEGAFVDHAFNTIDVCLLLDTTRLSARAVANYRQGAD